MDYDKMSGDDVIGKVVIPISQLEGEQDQARDDPGIKRFSLDMITKVKSPDPSKPCEISLMKHTGAVWAPANARRASTPAAAGTPSAPPSSGPFSAPVEKTFFLIRHGESKWNEAQGKGNVVGMIMHHDPPLNVEGIEQALTFNNTW